MSKIFLIIKPFFATSELQPSGICYGCDSQPVNRQNIHEPHHVEHSKFSGFLHSKNIFSMFGNMMDFIFSDSKSSKSGGNNNFDCIFVGPDGTVYVHLEDEPEKEGADSPRFEGNPLEKPPR